MCRPQGLVADDRTELVAVAVGLWCAWKAIAWLLKEDEEPRDAPRSTPSSTTGERQADSRGTSMRCVISRGPKPAYRAADHLELLEASYELGESLYRRGALREAADA
jgi:hypothetical protein